MTPTITMAMLIIATIGAWRWARSSANQRQWLIDAVGATAVYVEAWAFWSVFLKCL